MAIAMSYLVMASLPLKCHLPEQGWADVEQTLARARQAAPTSSTKVGRLMAQ